MTDSPEYRAFLAGLTSAERVAFLAGMAYGRQLQDDVLAEVQRRAVGVVHAAAGDVTRRGLDWRRSWRDAMDAAAERIAAELDAIRAEGMGVAS